MRTAIPSLVLAFAIAAGAGVLPAGEAGAPRTAEGRRCFDVRDFGAIGDGKANDTASIQKAIDACAGQGGGIVLVDQGVFLTGTLVLRSHVELHLTSAATLLGTTDLAQYHVDPQVTYKILSRSLLYAQGCEHVAITGEGTIDGQGKAFPDGGTDHRPVLIRLRDCRDVRLEGLLVKNSPSFGVHPIHCRQVRIEGLRIDSRVKPNSDGIDIDGCQDVFVSNCNISSGDDSIALKTIEGKAPCQDVVVTNCILSSDCAGIRVGPDAMANIERVAVSNCVIRDTGLNGIKIQESLGSVMRDMVFSNLVMDNVTGPISIRLAGWKLDTNIWAAFDDGNWEKGELRNILFENIRARVAPGSFKSSISITGAGQARPRDITFSNCDFTFPGGGTAEEAARRQVPDLERDYPECYIFGVLPAYGLYVHHARGLTLSNVQFHLASDDQRPALVCDDVETLTISGLQAEASATAESLLRLQGTQSALITGTRVLSPLKTFLRVEGEASGRIRLQANDLDLAAEAVSVAERVPADAVSNR